MIPLLAKPALRPEKPSVLLQCGLVFFLCISLLLTVVQNLILSVKPSSLSILGTLDL